MSDSDESGVTYTDISSPFEELSDIGSPRADDHEHLMLPEMLEDPYIEVAFQAPPSPDYIPGPEEPEQAPPSPDYIPGPEHVDDEIVAEKQPYAEDASPIAHSSEYVLESDFEAHPENDDDEDPEEDPVDYLADGEEEYPAPADSVVVAPTAADQAPSAEETEPFETDEFAATPPPHLAYRMTARISIPAPVPMPAWTDLEIREVGYGITDSWDEIVETLQGAPVSTDTELGGYVREFKTRVRQDTDKIHMRLDNEQTERQLLAGRLNMLFRDRHAHAYTRHLMETEAGMSREAWVRAKNASDLVHGEEVMSLRTTVLALQGQVTALQGQVTALQAQVTTLQGQQGLARGPIQLELPEETGMMTEKYCPRNEIRKLEMELWDLKVKGTDLPSYTQRYQELALLCGRMFSEESDKIEKYIRGLPDMIHGSVVASKPKTMQEAIEIATELM
nr:reverse transcriptase domain-containing protein [Tanacetum cinerariifolium]